jgi:hypothetical protein
MPQLVVLTGPIAAGENTVADKLAERLTSRGETVVVADVEDVAAMIATPGAPRPDCGSPFTRLMAHSSASGCARVWTTSWSSDMRASRVVWCAAGGLARFVRRCR